MKDLTDREMLAIIDPSLKQTAKDVRERRVPLDGRFRPILEEPAEPDKKTDIPNKE